MKLPYRIRVRLHNIIYYWIYPLIIIILSTTTSHLLKKLKEVGVEEKVAEKLSKPITGVFNNSK